MGTTNLALLLASLLVAVPAAYTSNAVTGEDPAAVEWEDETAAEAGMASDDTEDMLYTGIISAMENEIDLLLKEASIDHIETIGGVDFHVGELCGQHVVIAKAGVGKVLSAAGATTMIDNFPIDSLIFTGIAGGVGDETEVLDEVIATQLVQHDYGQITNDGFEWFEGYVGDNGRYPCDDALVDLAYRAAVKVVGADHAFKGTIATGDQFIASEEYVKLLQDDFDAIACEMEGAAIALVCMRYDVPFVVVRAMSDKADGNAHETYENMGDIAADNSSEIVMAMLRELSGEEAVEVFMEEAEAAEEREALEAAEELIEEVTEELTEEENLAA